MCPSRIIDQPGAMIPSFALAIGQTCFKPTFPPAATSTLLLILTSYKLYILPVIFF